MPIPTSSRLHNEEVRQVYSWSSFSSSSSPSSPSSSSYPFFSSSSSSFFTLCDYSRIFLHSQLNFHLFIWSFSSLFTYAIHIWSRHKIVFLFYLFCPLSLFIYTYITYLLQIVKINCMHTHVCVCTHTLTVDSYYSQ